MTSLTEQCYVLFEIHFSGSLMEANRSNKHFTKYDDLIRCSRALSEWPESNRSSNHERKESLFFHFKVLKFFASLFSGDHMT